MSHQSLKEKMSEESEMSGSRGTRLKSQKTGRCEWANEAGAREKTEKKTNVSLRNGRWWKGTRSEKQRPTRKGKRRVEGDHKPPLLFIYCQDLFDFPVILALPPLPPRHPTTFVFHCSHKMASFLPPQPWLKGNAPSGSGHIHFLSFFLKA